MNIKEKQFNDAVANLKKLRMDDDARETMRQSIMEQPVQGTSRGVVYSEGNFVRSIKKIIAGVSVVSVGFGGVAFASTDSLPNDTLYPVKTNIVEPLVAFSKISGEARQAYQVSLAQRRFDEMVILQSRGELDVQTQKNIQQQFDTHVARAQSYPSQEKDRDLLQVTINLFAGALAPTTTVTSREALPQAAAAVMMAADLDMDTQTATDTMQLDGGVENSMAIEQNFDTQVELGNNTELDIESEIEMIEPIPTVNSSRENESLEVEGTGTLGL